VLKTFYLSTVRISIDCCAQGHIVKAKGPIKQYKYMATNPPKGAGRIGAVKDRDQVHNPKNDRWVKRDSDTGKFIDQKHDKTLFKGVHKN